MSERMGALIRNTRNQFIRQICISCRGQIRSGFYESLTTQVLEIGETLAQLVQTVAQDLLEQRNTNIRAQLAAWARGATFAPQSLSRLVPCDHLPALPASIHNYTHRILVGTLAFFTSCHTEAPTQVIIPIFKGIFLDWVLVTDNKHTDDLFPHRITLHLAAKFMEIACRLEAPTRVPDHPTAE